jgi:hypothetical protein
MTGSLTMPNISTPSFDGVLILLQPTRNHSSKQQQMRETVINVFSFYRPFSG